MGRDAYAFGYLVHTQNRAERNTLSIPDADDPIPFPVSRFPLPRHVQNMH